MQVESFIRFPLYLDVKQLAKQYKQARPFPHVVIDDVFDEDFMREVAQEFPESRQMALQYDNPNERKSASKGELQMGRASRTLIHYLNSEPFLAFLQELTGIQESLIPDPYLEGGGFHEIYPGGFLKIHIDFHKHRRLQLDRRVNVLVYLNENWENSYGGFFELWEQDKSRCAQKIAPLFNRMVIFSTTNSSWHGHPDPLTCPPDRSRRSIALYYFTNGRSDQGVGEDQAGRITTQFMARPQQDRLSMRAYNAWVNTMNDILPPFAVRWIKKWRTT